MTDEQDVKVENASVTEEPVVDSSVSATADKPQTPEEIWASVMNEMYKTVAGVVHFLAGSPKYGWIKSANDVIFVASEFKTPEMTRGEVVGTMIIMGQEMVDQIRDLLDGKKGEIKTPVIH